MKRERSISWQDPVEPARAMAQMSGLDGMEAIRDGRLAPPPIAALMGFELMEVEEGRAVFAVTPDESHYNPIGAVHGGLAATLLDSATGCAVQTTLPKGSGYTTLELKANFVRAITKDTGRVLCEGRVIHGGKTVATAEARVVAEDSGKLLAHGTATCLVFSTNGRAVRPAA